MKQPLPLGPPQRPGIVLLRGARGALFLMSEIPLYLAWQKYGVVSRRARIQGS